MKLVHVVGDGAASIAMVLRLVKDGHTDVVWYGGQSIAQEMEGDSVEGRPYGIAYRTNNGNHLLNAPAAAMSLFPDEESFPAFLDRIKLTPVDGNTGAVFAPRSLYRQYLRSLLSKYWMSIQENVAMVPRSDRGPITARALANEQIILCLGATHRKVKGFRDTIQNPWDFDYERVRGARRVLIIGSGLTAIDTALSVWSVDSGVFVHFVSRSGRFPLSHYHTKGVMPLSERTWGSNMKCVRTMFREFRIDVGRGLSWVEMMNDARHLWKHIWRGLDTVQRRRFIRHIRPLFEIHRHRMVDVTYNALRDHPKKLDSLKLVKPLPIHYNYIFNATGVDTDPTKNPLLNTLIDMGVVRNAATEDDYSVDGLVGDRDCKVGANIWCVGAYMRPERWEATAMYDIVDMVDIVAKQIEHETKTDHPIRGPARIG